MSMGRASTSLKTVEAYLELFPKETRELLVALRKTLRQAVPEAKEKISYGIPTLYTADGNLVHFAGYDKHVGFYPGPRVVGEFAKELQPYKTAKGTVQFPLDRPLPLPLIARMTQAGLRQQVEQRTAKQAGRKAKV